MRVMSMSGLEPNFGEGDSGIFKELRARKQKLNEAFEKKVELSFDEKKIGEGVSQFFAAQLPAGKKIEGSKHPTAFAAVNAAFDEDDPRRELMPVVRDNYKALLRNKEYAGADENQLLDIAYQATVKGTPSPNLEGASIEDDIHRYKYKSDTALFGGGNVAAAPGYAEWLEKEKQKPIEDRLTGFGENAAIWGGFAAAGHVLRKPVGEAIGRALLKTGAEKAGQFLMRAAPPQGKLVGAVLAGVAMSIPDTLIGNAVRKTDWYRAREDEPVKRELAAVALGGLASAGAARGAAKQGMGALKMAAEKGAVTEATLKTFLKDSTAENIIAIGAARRAEKAALGDLENLLVNVAGKTERKAWFENLFEQEGSILKNYTDESALRGSIRGKLSEVDEALKLKSPVEGQPFGWAGEANAGTIFGTPGTRTAEHAPFDDFGTFGWNGLGRYGERTVTTPVREAPFEVYPFGQARRTGDQLALPPGSQLGLPAGGPGQPALPSSGVFGPRGFWTDVPPTEPPSGGAGGGGIFGFKPQELPKRTVVATTPEGQPIFGLSKKVQEQTFSKLSEDEAILVTDQVLNGGKSLSDALEGMSQSRAIRKALEATEAKVTVAQKKTTVLPPDNVIGYEGTEAAAESGKAAKVMVLKQEVAEAAPELAARVAAETKAVKSSADVLREIGQGLAPKGKESLVLADNLSEEAWNEQARSILTYLGDKSRKLGVNVPEDEVAKLRAAKAQGVAKPTTPVNPRTVRSEQKIADISQEMSDFQKFTKGQISEASYLKNLEDVKYRNAEAEKIYNTLVKAGVPDEKIDTHPAFAKWRQMVKPIVEKELEVVAPVADDLAEFGGMSVNKPAREELKIALEDIHKFGAYTDPTGKYVKNRESIALAMSEDPRRAAQLGYMTRDHYAGVYLPDAIRAEAKTQGISIQKVDAEAIAEKLRKQFDALPADMKSKETVQELAARLKAEKAAANPLRAIIPAAAVGTVSIAAVLGLPEDSHASVASAIGEAAARGIKAVPKAWISTIQDAIKIKNIGHADEKKLLAELIEKMDKANLVLRNADSKVLPPRAVVPNYVSLAKETYGSLEAGVNRQAKGLPIGVERMLSPYSRGEIHYKPGANPTVHLAHMQTIAGGNTENAFLTFEKIMADVKDGQSYAGDLIKEFQPLAEKYAPVIEVRNTLLTKVKQREKALAVLDKELARKKLPQEGLEKLTAKKKWTIDKLEMEKTALRNSDPDFQAYLKDYDVHIKSAAQKYPSTRIFLAAEDTQDFQHYPWLKDVITSEEKEAATYLKAMMKTYEESIVAQGMNVISDRPYMHHSWHPQWYKSRDAKWEKYAEQIGATELPLTTVPYNQFHSRMLDSRALVPDAWHSIQSYIPMAEKVLGWNAFWNKNGKVGESWYKHMRSSTVQGDPKLRSMWNAIYDASIPVQQTQVDKWANRYFQFEVFRLLGGSPSVAYKHLFKLTGTYSSSGVGEAISHFGEAGGAITRQWLSNPKLAAIAEKFGVNTQRSKKFYDDALRTFIHQAKRNNILDDYDLLPPTQLGWFDNMMQNINHHAGFMTSGIEGFDRAHQFLTAASMAAKRGLTERDASYAIFDGILKNNFLGGIQNPAWAKSTGVRALMLFQTTAFKIAERRLITAMKSGRALHEVWKSVKGTDWTYDKVLSEMKTLKNFMMKGEYEFKKGIITDALASERDFIGQFAIRQGVREMIYGGIILGGGAAMGHDYSHHLFHLPFLGKSQDGEPVVGLSPIARGAWDTLHGAKFGGEESDFGLVGDFLNNWFRSQGPIPQMISKSIKVSQDDIPEIYREEGFLPKEFRYFWAIPSTKEKE